jgi:sugar lactone lactonase YvrE
MINLLALGLALGSWSSPLVFQEGPEPPLQPATYRSASGSWELRVDPMSRNGEGAGDYELWHQGELVWKERHPFTFFEAVVAEDGSVAGYSYMNGYRDVRCEGSFVVATIGSDGKVRGQESTPRTNSPFMHEAPTPTAVGLCLDAQRGGFVVLINDPDVNSTCYEWRTYDLKTCKLMGSIRPGEGSETPSTERAYLWSVRALPDTPLFAAHSWVLENNGPRCELIDREGRIVWKQDLPGDLARGARIYEFLELRDRIAKQGGVLTVLPGGSFELWSLQGREKIAFQVRVGTEEASWKVEETGRRPFDAPNDPLPDEATVHAIELQSAGVAELRAAEAPEPGPVHDVVEIGFDAAGHLMLVRKEALSGYWTCLVLDASGEVLGERAFGPIETKPFGTPHWWPFESGRWLVSNSTLEAESQLWWADPATGDLDPIEDLDLPSIEAVASTGDGGFVALLNYQVQYGSAWGVASVDRQGRLRWLHASGPASTGEPSELLFPQDLAFTKKGLVVVVDTSSHALQLFRSDGTWVQKTDLSAALENEYPYPCQVQDDGSGGLLVHDFDSSNAQGDWIRVDLDGKPRGRIDPRTAEGRRGPSMTRNLTVAPDGRLWTHDGQVVMQLDASGVPEHCFGSEAMAEAVYEPDCCLVDRSGHVVVVDKRTKAVHTFDRTGKQLGTAISDLTEEEYLLGSPHLAVAPDESIFLSALDGEYVHLGCDGTLLGRVDLGGYEAVFFPHDGKRLVAVGCALDLIGANGKTLARIDRLPNRRWFGGPSAFTVASDGAIVVSNDDNNAYPARACIAWYAEDGSAQGAWEVPSALLGSRVAATGRWIASGDWSDKMFLLRRIDGAMYRFLAAKTEGEARSAWDFGFSPDGAELWMVQREPLRLHRFALPDQGK